MQAKVAGHRVRLCPKQQMQLLRVVERSTQEAMDADDGAG
jgi:hypothetical protein